MDEPDPLPLSALQHGASCTRPCALIHLAQAFDDTLRGNAVHAQADKPGVDTAQGVRALPLWHNRLGLIGKADMVDFNPSGAPCPVKYKHGNRHKAANTAQAVRDILQAAHLPPPLAAAADRRADHPALPGLLAA